MPIKVRLIPPKDIEGIKKSILEFLVDAAIESHTPQEIEAVLNYWERKKKEKVEVK
ncbi:hypothetical protein [Clostridium culturomicium]|uniref:hypothetical protein n=1 Tax=Clostridium culturomicium TaxID=1499683 RepID=UPI0038578A36